MKYRKKPIEVEAFYLDKSTIHVCPSCVMKYCHVISFGSQVSIETRRGHIIAMLPTWVILEADEKGVYPCDPEMFEQLYEKVEE